MKKEILRVMQGYRKYQRYQVSGNAVVIPRFKRGEQPIASRVNNISQGGIGVYTDVPLEKSTKVRIKFSFLGDPETGEESIIDGKVASLSENDHEYFLGIAFDQDISYDRFMKMINWY